MMKAVTTVAAIQLVEQRKMALDVAASRYLAELDKSTNQIGKISAGKMPPLHWYRMARCYDASDLHRRIYPRVRCGPIPRRTFCR
jgi:hypothetical protein